MSPERARRSRSRFTRAILTLLQDSKMLRIRAGDTPHRYIGIWFVLVRGRIFVRSWSVTARGWYRTLLAEPRGFIQVSNRTLRVCARRTRGERLLHAVDRAYLAKYRTPGSVKYARDLTRAQSRATTTELVP